MGKNFPRKTWKGHFVKNSISFSSFSGIIFYYIHLLTPLLLSEYFSFFKCKYLFIYTQGPILFLISCRLFRPIRPDIHDRGLATVPPAQQAVSPRQRASHLHYSVPTHTSNQREIRPSNNSQLRWVLGSGFFTIVTTVHLTSLIGIISFRTVCYLTKRTVPLCQCASIVLLFENYIL